MSSPVLYDLKENHQSKNGYPRKESRTRVTSSESNSKNQKWDNSPPEHNPAPTSIRGVYGFVNYLLGKEKTFVSI